MRLGSHYSRRCLLHYFRSIRMPLLQQYVYGCQHIKLHKYMHELNTLWHPDSHCPKTLAVDRNIYIPCVCSLISGGSPYRRSHFTYGSRAEDFLFSNRLPPQRSELLWHALLPATMQGRHVIPRCPPPARIARKVAAEIPKRPPSHWWSPVSCQKTAQSGHMPSSPSAHW